MKPLLSCKKVSQLASQGLDHRLGVVERVRLRLHSRLAEQSKP